MRPIRPAAPVTAPSKRLLGQNQPPSGGFFWELEARTRPPVSNGRSRAMNDLLGECKNQLRVCAEKGMGKAVTHFTPIPGQ